MDTPLLVPVTPVRRFSLIKIGWRVLQLLLFSTLIVSVVYLIQQQQHNQARQQRFQNELNQHQAIAKQTEQQIASLNQQLLKQSHDLPNARWLTQEAYYLVLMAQQQLQTVKSVANAKSQLETALHYLTLKSQPSMQSLVGQLRQTLSQLNAIPTLDKVALWQRLEQLINRLAVLEFKIEPKSNVPNPINQAVPWQSQLKQSWQEIKDLIKVTPLAEKPLAPMLGRLEKTQIRLFLTSLVRQAQLALLLDNQTLYQQTLQQVQNLTQGYFMDNQGLSLEIQSLATQSLELALPDLTRLLSEFHQQLEHDV